MALTIKKKDAVETVKVETSTNKGKGKEPDVEVHIDETNQIPVPGVETIPPDKLANVGMTAGFTHGLPNYSNCKGTVSLFYPCHIDDIDKTFDLVSEWVTGKIGDIHTQFTSDEESE